MPELAAILPELRACALCEGLPFGPKPIFQLHEEARILVAAQAPGRITHHKGRPFDDVSGDNLRRWMGIDRDTFYDECKLAMLPMGLCYPGKGKGGDLPPRPLCAETWRARVLDLLPNIRLTLVIGQYAHAWHLPELANIILTDRVRSWDGGNVIPLPHPSPRNGVWQKANPWFATELLPRLQRKVQESLNDK
jgi:uracil-DNA glycosylase